MIKCVLVGTQGLDVRTRNCIAIVPVVGRIRHTVGEVDCMFSCLGRKALDLLVGTQCLDMPRLNVVQPL